MPTQNTITSSRGKDLVGLRFGHLIVIARAESRPIGASRRRRSYWLCLCDCGATKEIYGKSLIEKRTVSCGCYGKERARRGNLTHGLTYNDLYQIWAGMLKRCYNPRSRSYPQYGGRGIKVCDRWKESVKSFIEDMGPRPSSKHSIDRFPDKDGGYEPGNCRWADNTQQLRNQHRNRLIEFNGETKCLVEWAETIGIKSCTLSKRLEAGWSIEKTLTTPLRSWASIKKPNSSSPSTLAVSTS